MYVIIFIIYSLYPASNMFIIITFYIYYLFITENVSVRRKTNIFSCVTLCIKSLTFLFILTDMFKRQQLLQSGVCVMMSQQLKVSTLFHLLPSDLKDYSCLY